MSRDTAWRTQASASPSAMFLRSRSALAQREELVGEARGADRGEVHLLELRAAFVRHRLRERELGVHLQPGERRAQLVRRVGEEALLHVAGGGHLGEQPVQRADQRARLRRRALGVDRPQVARRARLDLLREAREGLQAVLHAEPDDHQRGEGDHHVRKQALQQVLARQALALHGGLADEHGAGRAAAGRLHRDHAHLLAVVHGVVRDAVTRRRRQVGVARDFQAGGAHHAVEHAVEAVGAQHLLDRRGQLEAVGGLVDAHVRADREADVDQRLVVGLRGGLDRRVVRDHGADREQRGDRRQEQAQQVRPEASSCYLNSSSM
jgi:hypothetical protein